jgi:hypothetical protein
VNNETGILKTKRALKLIGQEFMDSWANRFCVNHFPQKIITQEGKMKQLITLHLLPWIMRSNSDLKIVILVDLKDYLVLDVLANLLRIITD